jgi:hypothetical protein
MFHLMKNEASAISAILGVSGWPRVISMVTVEGRTACVVRVGRYFYI